MKWTNVVLMSLTGMVLSGTGVYVVTPPGGYVGSGDPERPVREPKPPEGPFEGAHFTTARPCASRGASDTSGSPPGS